MLIGMVLNFGTGVFVNRLPAIYALLVANGLCTISPLLMALINPKWPYWYDAFFAQVSCAARILVACRRLIYSAPLSRLGGRTLHHWHAHCLRRLSNTHAGARWCSVQYTRSAWDLHWLYDDVSHFSQRYQGVRFQE